MSKDSIDIHMGNGTNGDAFQNGKYETTAFSNGEPHTNGKAAKEKQEESDDEKEKKKDEPQNMVPLLDLFRFATGKDKALIIIGIIAACIHGSAMPLMIIVFGEMTDLFINNAAFGNWLDDNEESIFTMCNNMTKEDVINNPEPLFECLFFYNMTDTIDELQRIIQGDLLNQMGTYAIYYCIIAAAVFVIAYIQVSCIVSASHRQCQRIRVALFDAIMRQEIGWFDTHEIGELNTRLSDDISKIQEGIGDKLGLFFQNTAAFFAGFIVAFIYGWLLALVILAAAPLLAISGAAMGKIVTTLASKELKAYAKAGAVAEEVLGAVRTVTAFGGQEKECKRYDTQLIEARDFGVKKGFTNGSVMGVIFFIMFAMYALAFWYGAKLVREKDEYTAGTVLVVFFAVVIGAFSIGNAAPNIQNMAGSRGAAYAVYEIIDRKPEIDSADPSGIKPSGLQGNISFNNVSFKYPSRPDVQILNSLNLSISVGQTMALVGPSGCGKSTTVQLIQRFYDPDEGQVTIDGHDVKEYNIKWLRQHIGVVSQEPVLFATTIAENIRYGRDGVSDAEIERAAREANAHDFITKLPKRYETLVGERGAQLSGGQKQRIAIARALVRDPKILLLDEATSALDMESEATVQAALDKARMGRTTVIVAHRLSTIKTADKIAGFNEGVIAEIGTHTELMEHKGIYFTLATNQASGFEDSEAQTKGDGDDDGNYIDLDYDEKKSPLGRTISVQSDGKGSLRKRTVSTSSAGGKNRTTSTSKDDKEEEEVEDLPEADVSRIMKMNAPETPFIIFGCFGALCSGIIQPAFAIIFAEILGVFSNTDEEEQEKDANFWSLMFLVIGIGSAVAMFVQSYCFSRSGEYLTMRMRSMTFRAMLRQDIGYFDDHKNSTGALTTRLAMDASAVQGATGSRLAMMIQSVASLGTGIIIGFIFSWELTLLIIGFAPFLLISGFIQMRIMHNSQGQEKEAMEEAGKIATEAIENMRTVAFLTKEDKFRDDYEHLTMVPTKNNLKKAQLQGVAYGFSQGIVFCAYAACFSLGAYLIQENGLKYDDMFKVFGAIVFAAMGVGQANSFAPDYGKAKVSAARLFALFDREPAIDNYDPSGDKPSHVNGQVNFAGVKFNYPTRPDIEVLKGVDVQVNPGQRLALVGSSGCGKSTIVSLLERFYDPHAGTITLDGKETNTLNIQWLRQQMGIVSQEPILFDCSIRDNIAYGDNFRTVTFPEIIEAAKMANIHNFIETLPEGYETNVGDKGTQLSGGQKQRVAIARALVRNPKILLLDEATSALDTESEKVVQEALDRAQEGRTSIVIAHRLSTIQNADCIVVVNHGEVAELGTHSQLLSKKGIYYRLVNVQGRNART